MKIINLTEDSKRYTSNVFLVLGTWNAVDDANTLIDVGSDENIIGKIGAINTGLGKKKVDQVILTHSHSDHSAILPIIKEAYNPIVYALNPHIKGVDRLLADGMVLRIAEQYFEVFHITAHSCDSVCLYCKTDGVLFAGDTSFPIEFENNRLKAENEQVLKRLAKMNIKTVYPGHGAPRQYANNQFRIIKEKQF
ncbi:MAG: MBL fold metallo-hydrolase [Bacteroidales bacterium]|nr:MBL fold metallo-hydrolase [Bacteroidales bacterium]